MCNVTNVLELSLQYFILNSIQTRYQADRLRSLFPQKIKFVPLLVLPILFTFPSKEVQNRWHHHRGLFQLVRLDLLMKGSLYAMLPMQMCSCTFSNVATVRNCPAVRAVSATA